MFGISRAEHAVRVGLSVPLGAVAGEGCGLLELLGIFRMRLVSRRSTLVGRSRCGASGVLAPGGSLVVWDHSPCEWVCFCGLIEMTLPTTVWDRQRRARSPGWIVLAAGRCGWAGLRIARARRGLSYAWLRADSRRSADVDVAPAGRIGVPAPGGSYVVWDHSPCVWFCLCRRIETTLPTVVWDQQRSVNVH